MADSIKKETEMNLLLNEVNDLALGEETGARRMPSIAASIAVCGPIITTVIVSGPIIPPIYRK